MPIVFYAWGEPKYLTIMLFTILINYFGALLIEKKPNNKKLTLIITILANLGFLIYFKYFNFLITNCNNLFHSHISALDIVMPIGISFYTFQALSYVIDVFRGETKAQHDIYKLALYICLFPQLIAGPIVKYHDVADQIEDRDVNFNKVNLGVKRFIIGLSKKVLIANTMGAIADKIFVQDPHTFSHATAWLGSIAYTFQLYFDFSGYCDMAVGLGLMFNIKLPINFNSPYKALNITDFWRRWHITLGRFLKAYLYIPLGGNQNNAYKQSKNYTLLNKILTLRNLFIVAFISGVWHGAGFGFIIWGTLHGLAMLTHRIYMYVLEPFNDKYVNKLEVKHSFRETRFYKILCWFITFNFINITWVFFRAENVEGALNLLKGMFGVVWVELPTKWYMASSALHDIQGHDKTLVFLLLGFLICLCCRNSMQILERFDKRIYLFSFFASLMFACAMFYLLVAESLPEFIYFNF